MTYSNGGNFDPILALLIDPSSGVRRQREKQGITDTTGMPVSGGLKVGDRCRIVKALTPSRAQRGRWDKIYHVRYGLRVRVPIRILLRHLFTNAYRFQYGALVVERNGKKDLLQVGDEVVVMDPIVNRKYAMLAGGSGKVRPDQMMRDDMVLGGPAPGSGITMHPEPDENWCYLHPEELEVIS